MRRYFLVSCWVLLYLGARAQGAPVEAVVARVNGDAILLSQLREAAIDQQVSLDDALRQGFWSEGYRRALTQFVDETLLVQEAKRLEIKLDAGKMAGVVDRIIQAFQERLGGREAMEQWLAERSLTIESMRKALGEREERHALADLAVARGVTVDSLTISEYRKRAEAEGRPLEEVNLSQIVVRCPKAEQGTEKGRELYRQALMAAREAGRDPAKFQELVAGYSDDQAGRQRGGSMGWVDPGTLIPDLRDKIAGMKQGEVSSPVVTEDGYHILFLHDRRDAREMAYSEEFHKKRNELLTRLRNEAALELYDFKGQPLKAEEQEQIISLRRGEKAGADAQKNAGEPKAMPKPTVPASGTERGEVRPAMPRKMK